MQEQFHANPTTLTYEGWQLAYQEIESPGTIEVPYKSGSLETPHVN